MQLWLEIKQTPKCTTFRFSCSRSNQMPATSVQHSNQPASGRKDGKLQHRHPTVPCLDTLAAIRTGKHLNCLCVQQQ